MAIIRTLQCVQTGALLVETIGYQFSSVMATCGGLISLFVVCLSTVLSVATTTVHYDLFSKVLAGSNRNLCLLNNNTSSSLKVHSVSHCIVKCVGFSRCNNINWIEDQANVGVFACQLFIDLSQKLYGVRPGCQSYQVWL